MKKIIAMLLFLSLSTVMFAKNNEVVLRIQFDVNNVVSEIKAETLEENGKEKGYILEKDEKKNKLTAKLFINHFKDIDSLINTYLKLKTKHNFDSVEIEMK